jgi:hypothetical protein
MADEHYQPILPEHPDFAGVKIDAKDPRYVSAAAAAREAGLTQAQWSKMLGMEARRVVDAHKASQATKAAPATQSAPAAASSTASAPAPAATAGKLSFQQKMILAGHV